MSISSISTAINASSPRRLLEISQIRRRLAFLGRHQQAVRTQEVILIADHDLAVAFVADAFAPAWTRIRVAPEGLVHAPRLRQGVVEHGNLIMKDVRITLIEMEPLLEDRLIVKVQRQSSGIVGARPLKAARLDL